jgi:hypothetical protein
MSCGGWGDGDPCVFTIFIGVTSKTLRGVVREVDSATHRIRVESVTHDQRQLELPVSDNYFCRSQSS